MCLERYQLNWIRRRFQAVAMILLVLAGCGMVADAQVCPVEIESVTRQALTSDMGNYGTALRISFRNSSKFPIRGIEFGIQVDSTENIKAKPEAIISYHPLLPDAVDSLVWNSTRFNKKNHASQNLVLWPALVELADGSRWVGKSTQCSYRPDSQAKTATPAAAESLQYTPKQIQDLIDNRQASLVNVTSDPPGASIDVDMKLIGKTPMSFVLIKNQNGASRNVMVYMNGYTLRERDVAPNGGAITINEQLVPLTNAR